ncbi:MAG: carboxypeptidase regulatory-like domain-containing protein [Gemmatimonadota bacterium]
MDIRVVGRTPPWKSVVFGLLPVLLAGAFRPALAQQPPIAARDTFPGLPCPTRSITRGALLYGVVQDAGTGIPLPGSRVELVASRARDDDTLTTHSETTADAAGRYWFCEAPTGYSLTVWAQALNRFSHTASLYLGDADPRRQDLSVVLRHREGGLAGELIDAGTGEPVEAASLSIEKLGLGVLTDSRGRFQLTDVPVGSYSLAIQHVAYGVQTASVEILPDQVIRVEIRLSAAPISVEPLTVMIDVRPQWLVKAGFYERRERGLGQFISPEELEKRQIRHFSQVLENIPGLQLRRLCKPHCYYVLGMTTSAYCLPTFYLDGRKLWLPVIADLNSITSAHDVAAVEVYRGISQTPASFYGPCGSIVVWTKRAAG